MQYKVLGTTGAPPSPDQLTSILNEGAQQGWELVEIVGGNGYIYVVFKHS